jgi:hypothetical protein
MATGRIPTTANSPLTAKGDIFTFSTGSAKLAVGNNGETLVADSAATVGLRYSAIPSASNPIINSAFDIWQRGTSSTTTGGYAADRWYAANNGNSTYSRQTTGDTTNLPSIQYCARLARNSGATSTDGTNFIYNFESTDSIPFAGKTVTLSFYARKGANLSDTIKVFLISGTGTDQNYWTTGFTGGATVASADITSSITTSWVRYTATGNVAATATQLGIQIEKKNVGTAGAADYVEVTGVMVNIGSVALPYRRNSGTLQGELAACQRYYYLAASGNTLPIASAFSNSATLMRSVIPFPVTMRTTVSLVATNGTNYYLYRSFAGDDLFNSLTIGDAGTNSCSVFNNTEIASTSGQGGYILTNNASASVAFSAEL